MGVVREKASRTAPASRFVEMIRMAFMIMRPDDSIRDALAGRLLAWFARSARDLPWRYERTPYRVWVAEVMLQQTQVETVVPYYGRFLARFPTVRVLAQAPLEEVLKVWEGLGYYARARNLHAAARQVVTGRNGQLPDTFEGLLALPGVGRYIAGAVASIAFGRDVVAVDGNVRRVLSRVFAIREDVTRAAAQRRLETLATGLLPQGQAGAFNEALMELGATVCTPRGPCCDRCPLRDMCRAYARGEQEALPVRCPRKRVPHYDVAAAVTIRADGRVLVAQRHASDMLGGLWEFPGGKREPGETLSQCLAREMREELGVAIQVLDGSSPLVVIEHAYTHFRITLHAFRCRLVAGNPRCLDCAAFRWVDVAELEMLPMSVVDRKVAQTLLPSITGRLPAARR
jgi:A/G-specific adenine glycosylase